MYDTQTSFTSSTLSVYVTPVNDAPTLTVPSSVVISTSSNTDIYSVSIADVDAGESTDEVLTLIISATTGTITLSSLTGLASATATPLSTSKGYPSISFRGTIDSINAAISPISYTPSSSTYSSESITVTVDDEGNTGDGSALTASATTTLKMSTSSTDVDTPTLSIPPSSAILEDSEFHFTQFSVSSPSSAEESTMAYYTIITISAGRGYFTYPSTFPDVTITPSQNNDVVGGNTHLTITGLPSDITSLLNSPDLALTPQSNHNGVDHLIFTVSTSTNPDSINTSAHNLYVTPVNDAPSIISPPAFNAQQGVSKTLSGIQLMDPDASDSRCSTSGIMTLTASLPSTSTSLISISPTVTGGVEIVSGADALTGIKTMIVRGSLSGLQSSINTLSYTSLPSFVGEETLTLTLNDEGNCGGSDLSDTESLQVIVYASNDPPTIASNMLTTIQGAR